MFRQILKKSIKCSTLWYTSKLKGMYGVFLLIWRPWLSVNLNKIGKNYETIYVRLLPLDVRNL